MSKKQIVQLSLLTFSFYLSMFFIITGGYEYYKVYWFITLSILLGLYIIYSQNNLVFIKYLRVLFYIVLGYFAYSIIDNVSGLYVFFSDFYSAQPPLKFVWYYLQDGLNLFFAVITSAVLLFNKQPKAKFLKIGKLKISF